MGKQDRISMKQKAASFKRSIKIDKLLCKTKRNEQKKTRVINCRNEIEHVITAIKNITGG